MTPIRCWCAVFVAALLSAGAAAAQDLPRGQVLETVATRDDATQSYALYLPSAYTTDRTWPILIGFHPGARGRAIVDTYREVAERYGFIVVGSNNSRNGPWDVSVRAANAMFQDIGQRFAVDGRRIYLTGTPADRAWPWRLRSPTSRLPGSSPRVPAIPTRGRARPWGSRSSAPPAPTTSTTSRCGCSSAP